MLFVLKEWMIFAMLAMVLLMVWAIVHELMRPWILQRKREVVCEHNFKTYVQEHQGRSIFHVMFCPKCGARRMGGTDIQVGVIESRKPKPNRKQRRAAAVLEKTT